VELNKNPFILGRESFNGGHDEGKTDAMIRISVWGLSTPSTAAMLTNKMKHYNSNQAPATPGMAGEKII
jgi:hypothetical protein